MKLVSFRNLRVFVLLVVLAGVAAYTKEQGRSATSWLQPIDLTLYPIAGDPAPATLRYIDGLRVEDFQAIDAFLAREGEDYKVPEARPVISRLGPTIDETPPEPPWNGSLLSAVWWSLRMRLWGWQHDPASDSAPDSPRIRIYVIYEQGRSGRPLPHSLGLRKGLIGVVHAYALTDQAEQNDIVIAHELLHTVGATDKYDTEGRPIYPDGFADPDLDPLYPQARAEIMAGRRAVSEAEAKMPERLRSCAIGEATAREIGWLD